MYILFCYLYLQNLVTYKWLSFDSTQRVELRRFLTTHLLTHHSTMPRFLANKFVKVITFIGRSDWPHEYPDFLRNMLEVSLECSTNLYYNNFNPIVAAESRHSAGGVTDAADGF